MEHAARPGLAQRKQKIRAVLFDKDGTLVDFEKTWFAVARELALDAAEGDEQAARRMLEAGGYDFEAGRFRGGSVIAAGTNSDVVGLWYPNLTGEARAARITEFDRKTAEAGARNAVAIEGAAHALARLHARGYAIGVATNDSTRGAELTVAALGFAPLMSAVLGYDIVTKPKPAADPVLHFAGATGISPDAIAVVGDNAHDLEMARAAGAGLAIGVLSGNSSRAELEPLADCVLGSVADLPAFFEAGGE